MSLVLTEGTGINLTPGGGNLSVLADAADLLALIKTVDGAGSGLDADLLDGLAPTAFATATSVTTNANGVSVRFSGGIQVCFRSLDLGDRKATGSGSTDSPFATTKVDITWPQVFSGTPVAIVTMSTDSVNLGNKSNIPNYESVSTTGMVGLQSTTRVYDSMYTSDITANVVAIGTWS